MTALVEIVEQAAKALDADSTAGVPEAAAEYFVGLVDRCPFDRGNYITAVDCIYLVAALNGWKLDVEPSAWLPYLGDVASGDLTVEQVARLIAGFLRPI